MKIYYCNLYCLRPEAKKDAVFHECKCSRARGDLG
jgi:hypothetical protein